jgi:GntR family transcriptional regulator
MEQSSDQTSPGGHRYGLAVRSSLSGVDHHKRFDHSACSRGCVIRPALCYVVASFPRVAPIQKLFRPFPKYLQVREILLRRLVRDLSPGDTFPTESDLCDEFGVSRQTVRGAVQSLVADGLISRHAGRGSIVLRRPDGAGARRLTGLVEDFTDLRLNTSARVLESGRAPAPPEVAKAMEVAEGAELFRITRVRFFEELPLALHDAFLLPELGARIAALDLSHTAIISELRETLRLECVEAWQQIDAMAADTPMARLLEITVGAPLLVVTRRMNVGRKREPVLFLSHFRADRYYYSLALDLPGRDKARPPG